jgi:dTDP-4-dehydrorhamnose reductase
MSTDTALILGGRTGLLGRALARTLEDRGWRTVCPGRQDLDVFSSSALEDILNETRASTIFNTIAYTAVDQAEEEPEKARRVNAALPEILGRVAGTRNINLVHYSTDFVFDGRRSHPYTVQDEPRPLCVYGRTKLEGERRLMEKAWPGLWIIRTAWLFGPGKTNFVDKILTLASQREEIRVVHDQVGSPTYTPDLAWLSLKLLETCPPGLYHLTNAGRASWCELAAEAVGYAGLHCRVLAVPSSEYPQKARRPAYSVLDTGAFSRTAHIKPRPWATALREYVMQRGQD